GQGAAVGGPVQHPPREGLGAFTVPREAGRVREPEVGDDQLSERGLHKFLVAVTHRSRCPVSRKLVRSRMLVSGIQPVSRILGGIWAKTVRSDAPAVHNMAG